MKTLTFSRYAALALVTAFTFLAPLLMAGCSTLKAVEPDTARVGVQHLSSISQHFGANRTDIGNNEVTVGAEWAPTKHTYIEVQDAYIVSGSRFGGGNGYEFFEARAGYQFNLK